MSVFNEFQKLWSQKFPNSSLKNEWKEDVRSSLERHREKIESLEKEIEKEKLYCLYLEKLLSDAENFKEKGSELPNSNEMFGSSAEVLESTEKSNTANANTKEFEDEIYLKRVLTELHEKSQYILTDNESGLANDVKPLQNNKNLNMPTLEPNQFVTVIEVKENTVEEPMLKDQKIAENKETHLETVGTNTEIKRPSERRYENVKIETRPISVNQRDESLAQTFTSTFSSGTNVLATAAAFNSGMNDIRSKKVPPRPPPKFIKRAVVDVPIVPNIKPLQEASDMCIERNIKPSDLKHKKSSESLEDTEVESVKEFSSVNNKPQRGSRDSTPTGSFGKGSSSGSLPKNYGMISPSKTDSRESVGSIDPVSGKLKSYESISSLNSDGLKASTGKDNEHYYDSVPLDNADGDYVYIQPSAEPESPGRHSNYVNIDYFLHNEKTDVKNSTTESDGDCDEHIEEEPSNGVEDAKKKIQQGRNTIIRQIISSIINSESLYVDCLSKMLQYMKAIRANLSQVNSVISQDDFDTIFYKIDDLYEIHNEFLTDLRTKQSFEGDICVGEAFKKLIDQIELYGAFLHNYGRAIETVKKCGKENAQFRDIVSKIVLNSPNEQTLTLEELLHKPVARVQKNALNIQDLLNNTQETHPDYHQLKQAQKKVRSFLSEFNVIQFNDKALRRLVKNSFIVELADGHRKLRHLFLFNDVMACAKYKPSGRDRFEFELKWFIPLQDIIVCDDTTVDGKDIHSTNIIQLKSQACTVRDQIMLEEKEEKRRSGEKHRKKLADLEAQLVLASPNLVFKISSKSNGKTMIFFLSSDFERTQWIDSILTLQQSCNLPGTHSINVYDLQAWIAACQSLIKTEMGSYLLRSGRDESLLVGDLHLTVQHLTGLEKPTDLYICIEVDSYGHYFRKAKTKLICQSTYPVWNESFIIELEGSQNIRVLLYEEETRRANLKAKHILQLSRQWLNDEIQTHKLIKLTETLTLNINLQFIPGELTLRRVPTAKPGTLFGNKLQNVLKREKRDIPFIISACIREVERRGLSEIGIYRVSGSASDLSKLKKSFESNSYEAEQLLKEVDIHSVTGILKSYLRELPEALFTDHLYQKLLETFNKHINAPEENRVKALAILFAELPNQNQATINLILEHLIRVNKQEAENKMSLHNLAMVFGPTLLRPSKTSSTSFKQQKDYLESSTVDVMAQAGILYCFLLSKLTQHK